MFKKEGLRPFFFLSLRKYNLDMPLGNDVLLTGIPRSGTTLVCSILDEQSSVTALHEPIDPASFDGVRGARRAMNVVVSSVVRYREAIIDLGEVTSKQKEGRIPDNSVYKTQGDGLRAEITRRGPVHVGEFVPDDLVLILKHNALFTSLLPDLAKALPVFAIVRNPLAVLASWQTVDFPVNRGRVPMGERFDPALSQELDLLPETLSRQLKILEWFFSRFRSYLARDRVITYEEIISTQGRELSRITGRPVISSSFLSEQSYGRQLPAEKLLHLRDTLLAEPVIYDGFYSPDDVANLFDAAFS